MICGSVPLKLAHLWVLTINLCNNNYCLTSLFDIVDRTELKAEFRKLHNRELCSLSPPNIGNEIKS